jgi:hypothetical protein
MCVEKTRGYVKNNKKKLVNAVVGWGRPVYTGEENAPLLNKLAAKPSTPKADPASTLQKFKEKEAREEAEAKAKAKASSDSKGRVGR